MTTETATSATKDRLGRLATHLERPLVVIDVGCRDGDATGWTTFGSNVHVIGFEPDVEECERLQESYDGPARRTFVPLALGGRSGEALLHLTRFPQSSSLYEPSTEAIERHPALTAHEEIDRRTVTLTTLDEWIDETDAPAPDFVKLDIQGAELDVLRSSPHALESVRALEVEVEFQPLYRNQPLFADVDAYLREQGFVLWRLRGLRHLAIAGAAPDDILMGFSVLADQAEMQPAGGQLSWGDAIYVRDDFAAAAQESWTASLRDACVATALGLPELGQVALRAAIAAGPPAAVEGELERAREVLAGEGQGRPDQAITPGYADVTTVEKLVFERDEARSEVYQLRDQLHALRALVPPTRKLLELRARTRYWSDPRLGVMRQHAPTELRVPRRQLHLRPPRNPPAIALVTPSYNQGEFVERTIRSVLDQSYPALEYAVQDGGSDDSTHAVLDRYRDRFAACVSEPDDGQADAINRGFAHTSGEIMGWLNSDDVLLPGALAAVARHFAKHPETDLVYGHRAVIDEDDRQVGAWILPPHEDWPLELADYVPQETMFWRRSLWEAAGGRLDPGYQYALDWELLLRFRDAGARMVRLPYVMGAFRLHADQKTSTQLHVAATDTDRLLAGRGAPAAYEDRLELLRPYLRRHVASHTAYRLMARAPGLMARVDLQPARAN
jgi:FkbM family methyltransferase